MSREHLLTPDIQTNPIDFGGACCALPMRLGASNDAILNQHSQFGLSAKSCFHQDEKKTARTPPAKPSPA